MFSVNVKKKKYLTFFLKISKLLLCFKKKNLLIFVSGNLWLLHFLWSISY